MEWSESMKCRFHDKITADNDIKIQFKYRLVHEHDFMDSKEFGIWCITCDDCYCNICGRLVEKKNTTRVYAKIQYECI